jgi:hypothetical protein
LPRIKRWFPVSHDINRDPEMWALCDRFGDKALRCWLEILSIADRNEGAVPGDINGISRVVSWAIRCKTTTTLRIVYAIIETGWLTNNNGIHVTNWSKYHRTWEPQKLPNGSLPSEPSEPNLPNHPPIVPQSKKTAQPEGFAEFWNLYPKKKNKGDAEKAWKAVNPDADLRKKITAAIGRARGTHDWLKQNGQFIPYPASWLRAKGWEDQGVTFTLVKKSPPQAAKEPEEKHNPEDIEKSRAFLNETISKLSRKMGSDQ